MAYLAGPIAEEPSMTLVSIVIPVFDAGRYLRHCLDSVRNQTHTDLQIICVDDGSTDTSPTILRSVAAADDRVRWLGQPNAGPGRARNVGLAQASGDYLMFVDADDFVPPLAVEQLLDSLTMSGSDMVSGRVLRLAGTLTWPSTMHEKALLRERRGTHLSTDTALLYDTTPWNKLFRRRFWTDNCLAFPEGVLYEDVSLMVEAHCRARAVDVIDDVVYHWRRREDGILSITMRRHDIATLEHRVASMRRVRLLLNELATPKVRHAGEVKSLKNDLGLYFTDLVQAPPEFQRHFVALVGEFLEDTPASALLRLATDQRVAYHLISRGETAALLEFLAFRRDNAGRLPVRRRWLSTRADVGPAGAAVPRAITDVRRRLPVRMGVDSVHWLGDHLVIEGYGFIDGVPLDKPTAALRRLKFVDRRTGRVRHVWLRPRRYPAPTARHDAAGPSNRWAGFCAAIPLRSLDPGSARASATWEVALQVLAVGAASGSALGPPRSAAARFVPVKHGPDGLTVSVSWAAERRLLLRVRRLDFSISAVTAVGPRLRFEVRELTPSAVRPDRLLLARSPGVDELALPLVWAGSGPDATGEAWLDPAPLPAQRGHLPYLTFRVVAQAAEETFPISTALPREVAHPVGADTLLIRADGSGGVEAVLTPARVAVESAAWRDGRLVLCGLCGLSPGVLPGLTWRNAAGQEIAAQETRHEARFEATFDPLRRPGPDGWHRLASGTWKLMRQGPDDSWVPVVAARGSQVDVEQASSPIAPDIAIWVDAYSRVSMMVNALPRHERGAPAQDALRKGPYRQSLRAPILDAVLVESWQGKYFADNPRAMVETARAGTLAEPSQTEMILAVTDRSIATPPGVRPVLRWSREYYAVLARARLIIANDSLTTHYVKRAGQRYLQTWHGTPLKRIGFDIARIHFRNKNYLNELRIEAAKWDWLVSPNAFSSEIMRRAFAYDGEILETGYPRNDVLAGPDEEARLARGQRARRWLGISPDTSVVLWAPTWRDDAHVPGGGYSASLLADLDELRDGLPTDTVVLFRGHHLTAQSQSGIGDQHGFLRNVSAYPDLRDLILASDVLVTDYSSIMFDYALTGRPSVFFVPDLAHYVDVRGLYLDLSEIAPGPLVRTVDELVDVLHALPAVRSDFAEAQRVFRQRFCPWDDGHAAERVWAAVNRSAP